MSGLMSGQQKATMCHTPFRRLVQWCQPSQRYRAPSRCGCCGSYAVDTHTPYPNKEGEAWEGEVVIVWWSALSPCDDAVKKKWPWQSDRAACDPDCSEPWQEFNMLCMYCVVLRSMALVNIN